MVATIDLCFCLRLPPDSFSSHLLCPSLPILLSHFLILLTSFKYFPLTSLPILFSLYFVILQNITPLCPSFPLLSFTSQLRFQLRCLGVRQSTRPRLNRILSQCAICSHPFYQYRKLVRKEAFHIFVCLRCGVAHVGYIYCESLNGHLQLLNLLAAFTFVSFYIALYCSDSV